MKTIIQLVIVALIVHGCVRMGAGAWRNYQFKDAIEQEARFIGASTTSEMHKRIVELAAEHEIYVESGDVVVERRGQDTYVATSYSESIPLVPGFYTREHRYEIEVRVRVTHPLTVDDLK